MCCKWLKKFLLHSSFTTTWRSKTFANKSLIVKTNLHMLGWIDGFACFVGMGWVSFFLERVMSGPVSGLLIWIRLGLLRVLKYLLGPERVGSPKKPLILGPGQVHTPWATQRVLLNNQKNCIEHKLDKVTRKFLFKNFPGIKTPETLVVFGQPNPSLALLARYTIYIYG